MGRRALELVGQRFGRAVVVCRVPSEGKAQRVLIACDCGGTRVVVAAKLKAGEVSQSCGCLKREQIAASATRHGHGAPGRNSGTYVSWRAMIDRCRRETHPAFARYGGRGIRVCDRWQSYEAFLADMGPRPSRDLTIERVNNDRGYEPSNCVWASWSAQLANRARS